METTKASPAEAERARLEALAEENDGHLIEAERMDWHGRRAYCLRRRVGIAERMANLPK